MRSCQLLGIVNQKLREFERRILRVREEPWGSRSVALPGLMSLFRTQVPDHLPFSETRAPPSRRLRHRCSNTETSPLSKLLVIKSTFPSRFMSAAARYPGAAPPRSPQRPSLSDGIEVWLGVSERGCRALYLFAYTARGWNDGTGSKKGYKTQSRCFH